MIRLYKDYMALPFILLLLLVLDAVLVTQFPFVFNGGQYIIVPHLLLLALVHIIFAFPTRRSMVYAFIMGFLCDSFYSGILGIYVTAFCLLALLIIRLRSGLPSNIVTILMTTLIGITLVDSIAYVFYFYVLHRTAIPINSFLLLRLAPTWLFNIVIYLCTYLLFRRLVRWAKI